MRHDKALLATVFAQPVMMLFLMGFALVQQAGQRAAGRCSIRATRRCRGACCRRSRPPATSSRRGRCGATTPGEQLLQRGDALAFVVIPKDFRRDVERGQPQVQVLVDGSDPLQAARVGGYIGQVAAAFDLDRGDGRGAVAAARRGAVGERRPRRRAPALLVQPDAARSHLLPGGACRHAADEPVHVGDQRRAWSPSARAARTSRCWRCRRRRSSWCSASWCRTSG